jgi:hypothetical protein
MILFTVCAQHACFVTDCLNSDTTFQRRLETMTFRPPLSTISQLPPALKAELDASTDFG